VAGHVQHLDGQLAEGKRLAVAEQPVEVAAVGLHVLRIEDRAEDALHVADVLADADARAGARLDEGRGGQVVGMGVGFQHPGQVQPCSPAAARIASAERVSASRKPGSSRAPGR
jgi:hypothetical protein